VEVVDLKVPLAGAELDDEELVGVEGGGGVRAQEGGEESGEGPRGGLGRTWAATAGVGARLLRLKQKGWFEVVIAVACKLKGFDEIYWHSCYYVQAKKHTTVNNIDMVHRI